MNKLKTLLAAGALVATSGAAQAVTVTINGGGELECSLACTVLDDEGALTGLAPLGTFGSPGEIFNGPAGMAYGPGNPVDQEVAWLNDVTGSSYSTSDASKTEGDGGYFTGALYVILKLGNNYTIMRNDSGTGISWSFTPSKGTGTGLSHSTTVGEVPVPAAGFLLLGGLGGLALLRRRRKA